MTFSEHKEQTAKDIEEVAKMLTALAAQVREGDMDAFVKFWLQGGTEEGDPKIDAVHEMLILRYACRLEKLP